MAEEKATPTRRLCRWGPLDELDLFRGRDSLRRRPRLAHYLPKIAEPKPRVVSIKS